MKLRFYCTNCEAKRTIIVKKVGEIYVVGICEECKSKITINRVKAHVSV